MTNETTIIWDFLTDNELATDQEIELVTSICGFNAKALNDILQVRTEYHDIAQIYSCEPDSFYFRDSVLDFYGLNESEDTDE